MKFVPWGILSYFNTAKTSIHPFRPQYFSINMMHRSLTLGSHLQCLKMVIPVRFGKLRWHFKTKTFSACKSHSRVVFPCLKVQQGSHHPNELWWGLIAHLPYNSFSFTHARNIYNAMVSSFKTTSPTAVLQTKKHIAVLLTTGLWKIHTKILVISWIILTFYFSLQYRFAFHNEQCTPK